MTDNSNFGSGLIYFFDPMCGWCYGFSKVMLRIYEEFSSEIDIDAISGGMVLGNNQGPLIEKASFIGTEYQRVQDYSGAVFGSEFLDQLKRNTGFFYGSEKPSLAFQILKKKKSFYTIPIAHDLQREYYLKGKDLSLASSYEWICHKYNVNFENFKKELTSKKVAQDTYQDFHKAQQLGINGYPTLIYSEGDSHYLLTRGYQKFSVLENEIINLLDRQIRA